MIRQHPQVWLAWRKADGDDARGLARDLRDSLIGADPRKCGGFAQLWGVVWAKACRNAPKPLCVGFGCVYIIDQWMDCFSDCLPVGFCRIKSYANRGE